MRLLLVAAIVAVAGMAYLLLDQGPGAARDPRRQQNGVGGDPDPTGPHATTLPDPAAEPERFVEAAAEDARSIDEILAFLESGKDRALQPRWAFGKNGLAGFPTLRSIYISALGGIPGARANEALAGLLSKGESLKEAYLAALLLAKRKDTGWEAAALDRVAAQAGPRYRTIRSGLLATAVASAPAASAEYLLRKAPRGDSTDRPVILAKALFMLPWQYAEPASRGLVADPAITHQAKILYVKSFLERGEVEAIATLTNIAERRELDERMAVEVAYAVARSKAFDTDRVAIQTAIAKGDHAAAAKHRERFQLRLAEARRFIQAALGFDVETSDDPRAAPLRRLLNRG